MQRSEALKSYSSVIETSVLVQYRDADSSFCVNDNDPDLTKITLSLPSPPKWHLIEGFGKPARAQKFVREKIPSRLNELQRDVTNRLKDSRKTGKNEVLTAQRIIEEIWEVLNRRQREYVNEINWIKKQIYHCHYGYWLFINGKPTYLDGWHYRFLNFWDMTDAEVDYRDRDRRWFLFARYIYTTQEDEFGYDTGHRTFFGFTYPKHRRDGATHKSLCIGYDIMTKTLGNVIGGIQSFDDDNAGEHYKNKMLPAFKSMPFFFKPVWKGSQAPQSELHFTRVDNSIGDELGSKVNYATTAARKFYDGKKLYYYQSEEGGKTLLENVKERWDVVKQTLGQGAGAIINGFSIHPTTVADMKVGGGKNFSDLCDEAKFYDRNPDNGQTKSGLARLFIPGYDGLEGFIGPYGESIIEMPTEDQANFIGRPIGAKAFIQSQLNEWLKKGDPDSMRSYREFKRLYPTSYADCFRDQAGDAGLDIEKLDAAIERLRRAAIDENKPPTTTGNLLYIVDGESNPLSAKEFLALGYDRSSKSYRVEWFPTKSGRWKVSKILGNQESNLRYKSDGIWYPTYPFKYTLGADPFQFLKTGDAEKRGDKSRLSKGGIAVFYERDFQKDPEGKDSSAWDSYRFVVTYDNRADEDDEYAEEVLMTAIYWGAEVYPEQNIKLIWKHIVKRGFGGYMKYQIDEATGKRKDHPGFYSLTDSKQDLFNAIKRYIFHHSTRERHIDFLLQCRQIRGLDYMTDFDLFVACGGALLGSQIVRYESEITANQEVADLSKSMPMFIY